MDMIKLSKNRKNKFLTQVVLASSLFATSPLSQATLVPPNAPPFNATILVSTYAPFDHLIEVPGGIFGEASQIQNGITPLIDLIVIDTGVNTLPIGTVQVDANNIPFNLLTILNDNNSTFDPNSAINITSQLGGIVTVGVGSGIESQLFSDILAAPAATIVLNSGVGGGGVTITNSGTIQSKNLEITIHLISATGPSFITNNPGAVIQNLPVDFTIPGYPILQTEVGSGPLTLHNTGIFNTNTGPSTNTGIPIMLLAPFTLIFNHQGGIIQGFRVPSSDSIILIAGPGSHDLHNAGIIYTNSTNGINVTTSMGLLDNSGDIILGNIGSATGSAIILNTANVQQLNNSGLLYSNSNTVRDATIQMLTSPSVIGFGFFNTGRVVNAANNSNAIDFSGVGNRATVNQNGGAIVGNVVLAPMDSFGGKSVLVMTGGVINGDIIGQNLGNIFNLNGGTINGSINAGTFGDTFNFGTSLTGVATSVHGAVNGGIGNDLFAVFGQNAGFLALNGNGGVDTLNINNTFIAKGPISNINIININKTSMNTQFTLNAPIIAMNDVLTNNAIMLDQGDILNSSGNINNNGLLVIAHNSNYLLDAGSGGTFTNKNTGSLRILNNAFLNIKSTASEVFDGVSGSNLNIDIAGILAPGGRPTAGQLLVNDPVASSTDFESGSIITPTFIGVLPIGTQFTIVQAVNAAGTINDNATLINPNSAVISFTKTDNFVSPNTTAIILTTQRNTYTSLVDERFSLGAAAVLDELAGLPNGPNNQNFLNLLAGLDQWATAEEVNESIRSLIPPFNYGLIAGSHLGMDIIFDGVQDRLLDLHARRHYHHPRHTRSDPEQKNAKNEKNGLNYGDPQGLIAPWIRVMGGHLDQSEREKVAGYKANGMGGVLGLDWVINDCIVLGAAGSYTKVNVDDKANFSPKDIAIRSWEGVMYAWVDITNNLFVDGMISYARNHYQTNRVINLFNAYFSPLGGLVQYPSQTAAIADFHGNQWGGEIDVGWALWDNNKYYLAPIARVKWINLQLDDYSEYGAGYLNLDVSHTDSDEFIVGVGFKTGMAIDLFNIQWFPELTALIAYDIDNDAEETLANFDQSPVFTTNGLKPGRTILDLGFSVNASLSTRQTLTLKYDLTLRDDFVGNVAYLEYTYLWQ